MALTDTTACSPSFPCNSGRHRQRATNRRLQRMVLLDSRRSTRYKRLPPTHNVGLLASVSNLRCCFVVVIVVGTLSLLLVLCCCCWYFVVVVVLVVVVVIVELVLVVVVVFVFIVVVA